MREMKDSGVEWIGKIPTEWDVEKLKYNLFRHELRNYIGKSQVLSVYREYGVIPKDSRSDNHNVTSEDTSNYKLVKPNNLVINKMKAWQGSMGISNYEGIVSPAYFIYKFSNKKILPQYLHYLLRSCYKDEFRRISGGIREGQWDLSPSLFENTLLLIPSVVEQDKIVSHITQKCSEIDALTADIQTQIETLEEYKKSVITEAVTKGLDPNVEMKDSGVEWIGEIPKEWNIIKAKYIFSQRNERGNTKSLQLLSPTQKYGVIPQSMYEELTGMKAVKLNDKTDYSLLKTIHSGDFCISLRSFQGGFEYSDYEGVVSPAYQIFYPTVSIVNKYYKFIFKDQSFIEKMNSYTLSLRDGKNIAFDDFGNSYLPVPSLQEQQKIADFLDKKCSEIDLTISEKQQQLETLAEYKKSLIYEYVTGKKEVA